MTDPFMEKMEKDEESTNYGEFKTFYSIFNPTSFTATENFPTSKRFQQYFGVYDSHSKLLHQKSFAKTLCLEEINENINNAA